MIDNLLLENGIVDANKGRDGSARQNALVTAVDGPVETLNGGLGEETTKGDTLAVDHERHKGLDNAESQGVNIVLSSLSGGLGAGPRSLVAGGTQVEEVTQDTGQDKAGKRPCQERRPEASSDHKEQVGHVNRIVRGAKKTNGGDSESVAGWQDLGADAEKLKRRDNREDAGDGAQGVTGSL